MERDGNPKDAIGIRKAPMSCVSGPVMTELGLALLEGSLKYGRHNYRAAPVRLSVYYDAAMRHMLQLWEGENIDPDSGLPHHIKAMACMAIIRDAQLSGTLIDDRPVKTHKDGWMTRNNDVAEFLMDKFPDPVAPYLEEMPKCNSRPTSPTPTPSTSKLSVLQTLRRLGPGSIPSTPQPKSSVSPLGRRMAVLLDFGWVAVPTLLAALVLYLII